MLAVSNQVLCDILLGQKTHRASPSGVEIATTNLSLLRKRLFGEPCSLLTSLEHLLLVWAKQFFDAFKVPLVNLADSSSKVERIRYSVEGTFAANCVRCLISIRLPTGEIFKLTGRHCVRRVTQ